MALYGDIFDEMHIFPRMTVLLFFSLASWEESRIPRKECKVFTYTYINIYILLYKYGQEAPSGTYRVGYPKQVGSGT